jgi:hypothetical protein
MELLEIIIFSIKIFALVSGLIVISSYIIYKYKDRKRTKPYAKAPVQPLTPALALPAVQLNSEIRENSQSVITPAENIQYANIQYGNAQYQGVQSGNAHIQNVQYDNEQYQNIQYDNNQYSNLQYDNQQYLNQQSMYQNSQPRSYGQRFRILNENDNDGVQRQHIIEKLQPVAAVPQRLNNQRKAQVFNIYDYYSSSNFEPMHKIKS